MEGEKHSRLKNKTGRTLNIPVGLQQREQVNNIQRNIK